MGRETILKNVVFCYENVGFSLIQKMWVSSNKRPKKRVYHRVHELDHAIDLQKRPRLVLQLKDILLKQRGESILLRDLEKEVGLIAKWNFMACIQNYPKIFKVSGGNRKPPLLEFTDDAKFILRDESMVKELMEPILVKNLRKLLMMSSERRIPLFKIEQIKHEMGLPEDFAEIIVPKYPQFFKLEEIFGVAHLVLEEWDPLLAVTARELGANPNGLSLTRRTYIPKDGNFDGPYAFKINYPDGFKPRLRQLEEMAKWQNMAFSSPYTFPMAVDVSTPASQKRFVAVLHEVLSLTLEKRLTANKLDAFHVEYKLPSRLLHLIVRHNGIFYLTNKGAHSTVFLKEAYEGHNVIDKCVLLRYHDRFLKLMGRKDLPLRKAPATIELKRDWIP
ncbi:hypothetical protein SUGI_0222530 [Cryptomeria japonica]|nr:hypothetical protein SUGI_0222530 [Cryptomeria japonica]